MAGPERRLATTPPTLRTLGALHLAGSPLTRPKPLLLLAYLAHEGPTDRDRLARLFFGASRDPRDALTTTVRRLGDLIEGATEADRRLRTRVVTDALVFQQHAISAEPTVALGRYGGAFLEGSSGGCSTELEEWIVSTREHLGSIARDLHLALARTELGRQRSEAAWQNAKAAVVLTETFALEPEPVARLLQRLDDAGLPVSETWWRAMAALGIERGHARASTSARVASDGAQAGGGRRKPRPTRLGTRPARDVGPRRPRRLAARP
jgi:hypothetical protein